MAENTLSGSSKTKGRQTLEEIFLLARDTTLSDGALRLWLLYRSYDSTGMGSYVSDANLSRDFGMSLRTLGVYRRELKEKGFLVLKQHRGPRPPIYVATVPRDRHPIAGLSVANTGEDRQPIAALTNGKAEMTGSKDTKDRQKSTRKTGSQLPTSTVIENGNKNGEKDPNGSVSGSTKSNAYGRASVTRIWDHWIEVSGKEKSKLTKERGLKIRARLKSFTEDELCEAINRAHQNPFYLGENDRATYYGNIETIFKSDTAVAKHLEYEPRSAGEKHRGARVPAGAGVASKYDHLIIDGSGNGNTNDFF